MRSGFEVQKTVVMALFLREMQTRFGKFRLGYFWALLEPASHLFILVAAHSLIRGSVEMNSASGISYPVYFIAGIVPWFLFSNIAIRSLKAVEANSGLFNYRPVKPIDTILARALLELVIYSVVYSCMLLLVFLYGEPVRIDNLPFMVGVYLLLCWFGLGVGLIFMAIGDAFSEAEKIIPMLIQPLYFLSGMFFSLENIPKKYHFFIIWNPLLHAVELGRNAIFPTYDPQEANIFYLFISALTVNVVGLFIYRSREKKMLST